MSDHDGYADCFKIECGDTCSFDECDVGCCLWWVIVMSELEDDGICNN